MLRRSQTGERIYDSQRRQTVLVHEEFNFLKKNIWSSKEAQEVINSRISKGEVFKRFFDTDDFHEDAEETKQAKSIYTEDPSEGQEIGSLVSGSVDNELLRRKHEDHKERPPSRESISEEDDLNPQSQDSYSSEGGHSFEDEHP